MRSTSLRVHSPSFGLTRAITRWQSGEVRNHAKPEFWNSFAKGYAENMRLWSLPAIQSMVSTMQLDKAHSCLEVGCGPGYSIPLLRAELAAGAELVSTDFSEDMVALAKEHGDVHDATVCTADAMCLPAEFGGRFDRIFSSLCLHIVPGVLFL